jgi:hypothetical protein
VTIVTCFFPATVSRSTFESVLDAPTDESTTRNNMQIEQIRGRYECSANRELSRMSGAAPECFVDDLAIKVGNCPNSVLALYES